jgi:hypothetical protein
MRRVTGNTFDGMDVSQILKSGLVSLGGYVQIVSWILSKFGINDGAK